MLQSSNAGDTRLGCRGSGTFNCLEQTERGHSSAIDVSELDFGLLEGVVDDKGLASARTT